jgi:hypothetical protein
VNQALVPLSWLDYIIWGRGGGGGGGGGSRFSDRRISQKKIVRILDLANILLPWIPEPSVNNKLKVVKALVQREGSLNKAVLSGYITTLKNKQKLDVSSEGPSLLTLDEGPSLETSIFCLFFKVVI